MNVWKILGIPHGSDRDAIRRAYATKLRITNPEDDPEGFKRLRAAYETALRHLEYQSWHDIEDDENGDEDGNAKVVTAAEPAAWDEPRPGTLPEPGEPAIEPELVAMPATREAELEALRGAMAQLEKGLRGPWWPDDSALGAQLEAVLRSPALAEIRIRTEVEPWLADLLAATIPHSDAVLLQSIQAFCWLDGDRKRSFNPAIAAVLERLDEWRLIESLNRPSHVHHAAWRSLTRPPGPWWPWRIAAFKLGMIAGIEVFLGIRGQVARGLHYSYRKESVERWQRFLAKPRLTLGILALMPLAFLALFGLGTVLAGTGAAGSGVVVGGMSAIAFATPFAALHLLPRWQRRWRERLDHPRWLSDSWLIAYIALPIVAVAVPPPYWPVIVILPAVAIAVWAYIVEPLLVPEPLPALPTILVGGLLCSVGTLAFWRLDPAQSFAISVMAALLVYFRLSQWAAVQTIAGRWWLEARREWFTLGLVSAVVGGSRGLRGAGIMASGAGLLRCCPCRRLTPAARQRAATCRRRAKAQHCGCCVAVRLFHSCRRIGSRSAGGRAINTHANDEGRRQISCRRRLIMRPAVPGCRTDPWAAASSGSKCRRREPTDHSYRCRPGRYRRPRPDA